MAFVPFSSFDMPVVFCDEGEGAGRRCGLSLDEAFSRCLPSHDRAVGEVLERTHFTATCSCCARVSLWLSGNAWVMNEREMRATAMKMDAP